MTQADLNCEVARATGESPRTIGRMGFARLTRHLHLDDDDREPLVIDWDEMPDRRYSLLP